MRLAKEIGILLSVSLVAAFATKALHPRSPAWYLITELGEDGVTEKMVRERWDGDVL